MKIVLNRDIANLGKQGDVKEVKSGYALNYLLPQNLVSVANLQNLTKVKRIRDSAEKYKKIEVDKLKETADILSKHSFNIQVKTGTSGKLFGAITKDDISKTITKTAGISVDKHDISLTDEIKETGIFNIDIKLRSAKFPDEITETARIKLWVVDDKTKS